MPFEKDYVPTLEHRAANRATNLATAWAEFTSGLTAKQRADRVVEMAALRADGASYGSISEQFGLSHVRVRKLLKRAGLFTSCPPCSSCGRVRTIIRYSICGSCRAEQRRAEQRSQRYLSAVADFWALVDVKDADECWLWRGFVNPMFGRGVFRKCRTLDLGEQQATRLMWRLVYGPIPRGIHVCHSCDVPLCVNPEHLWLGTPADNMRDRDQKGRGRPAGKRTGRTA